MPPWQVDPRTSGLALASITVTDHNAVWALSAAGIAYRYKGDWLPVAGELKSIATSRDITGMAENDTWAVNKVGKLVRWSGTEWSAVASDLVWKSVSLGTDGSLWAIDSGDYVRRCAR